tara:strand:- start:1209 stop:1640 length:432 start_codon:yes stop_codon:yes gene_type:complete
MKYTNGKKADSSAFPFKVDNSKAVSDSPVKVIPLAAAGGAAAGLGIGAMGMMAGGGLGLLSGGLALKRKLDGTTGDEKQYEAQLKEEGLERNFWGKLGFGGARTKERARRIEELKEQDQMGIDRERIESRGGVTAGPGADADV